MVKKTRNFIELKNFVDHDVYHDFKLAEAGNTESNHLCEIENLLEQNGEKDVDYVNFLLCILNKGEKFVPPEKQKEINDNIIETGVLTDDENDPQYENFLKSLKTHEKSYILECEKDGLPLIIKYEEDSGSDEECDPEPKRRQRNALEKECGLPNPRLDVKNQMKHAKKLNPVKMTKNLIPEKSGYGVNNQTGEALRKISTTEMLPDLEYLTFLKYSKPVGDYFVYSHGGKTVVYEKDLSEDNQERETQDDEQSSDVEILDSTTFFNEENLNTSKIAPSEMKKNMVSEFRQHLITLLRKSYDKEEYCKLLKEIKIRKPEVRHKDLRRGRQYSYSSPIIGKSYLDNSPDLKVCLLKFKDDKPKCLNLLRGYFFWLQKINQEGSFKPWMDAECLAISPGSSSPFFC